MCDIIWIGPRESDIEDCESYFSKSITIFGSNKGNNRAFSEIHQRRVNHNETGCVSDDFWNTEIKEVLKHSPDAKIMYYNSEFSASIDPELRNAVICSNPPSLLKTLADKKITRTMFRDIVPIVPFQILDPSADVDFTNLFNESSTLIFQETFSSGGYGTYLISSDEPQKIHRFDGRKMMISPYFSNSVPVNVHLMIAKDKILFFPGSVQIVKKINGKLLYLGADYIAFQSLKNNVLKQIRDYSIQIGHNLQKFGYLGVLGIDFLVTEDQILFTEINARFQASTPLLNMALRKIGLPSMQKMQLSCFENTGLPTQEKVDRLSVEYSMISYTKDSWEKSYDLLETPLNEVYKICTDGFSPMNQMDDDAYLFKFIFSTNCSWISPDMTVFTYENLLDIKGDFYDAIIQRRPLEVKISLLNQGVRISSEALVQIEQKGKLKNAVFSAVDLTILDDLHVNCPKQLKFSEFSPWEIVTAKDNSLWLQFHGKNISPVTLDLEDRYGNNRTSSGIPYSRICFWATDRIRVHHNLTCCLKNAKKGCKFCEIMPSNQQLSIQEVLDVIDFYIDHANEFRHFLIGGGSEPRDVEYKNVLAITNHIRKRSKKPIYLMSWPPQDLSVLEAYYKAGITEIGFNIELFDETLAYKYMPGKGSISRAEYIQALRTATQYWGTTGKVRSLLILGLEKEDTLLQGIQQLCEIGVMPILSVFRPIPGTETEDIVPPSNEYLRHIYHEGTKICDQFGLHLGPDCPACQNNTLSLPFLN